MSTNTKTCTLIHIAHTQNDIGTVKSQSHAVLNLYETSRHFVLHYASPSFLHFSPIASIFQLIIYSPPIPGFSWI